MRLRLARLRFAACILGCAVWVAGCNGGRSGSKAGGPPKVLAHPVPADRIRALDSGSGKVVRVDARLKFVVLDFALTAVPQPGLRLEVVRDGKVVGELRLTGPASGTATVADLVSGEAVAGDLARPQGALGASSGPKIPPKPVELVFDRLFMGSIASAAPNSTVFQYVWHHS